MHRCCSNRCSNKHLESFLMTRIMRRFKTTSSTELVVCSIKFACTIVKWTDEVVLIVKEQYILFKSNEQYGPVERRPSPRERFWVRLAGGSMICKRISENSCGMQIFGKHHTPKMQEKVLSTHVWIHYITCRENRTENRNKTCVVPPIMPQMQHSYYTL